MAYATKPGTKARVAEIQAEMLANGQIIMGFCRCPKPHGQAGKSLLRENMLIDVSEFDNQEVRCLTCGSTYSAAGF